jgi:thioredoxin reductase (NADPH)
MTDEILDLVIIGAGPAGLAAAIYANRAMLKFVLLEKAFPGGQIVETHEIDNYPGINNISGIDLGIKMLEHAQALGVEVQTDEVLDLDLSGEIKRVATVSGIYQTRTVILASGAHARSLGVPGEAEFTGRGVSTCAVCDGAFYRGRTAVVVGGGDVAVKDTIYLSRLCKKVTLVHRRHALRAVKALQAKLFELPNVEIVWDSVVTAIHGDEAVRSVTVQNKLSGDVTELHVDGVFIAVGTNPNSALLRGKVDMDEGGFIFTDEDCETSVKGVFAAGDVRRKSLRQVVTSAADGAIAEFACEKYL